MHQQCIPFTLSELAIAENVLLRSAKENGFPFEVSMNLRFFLTGSEILPVVRLELKVQAMRRNLSEFSTMDSNIYVLKFGLKIK